MAGTLRAIGEQAGGLGEFLRYQDKLKQQEFEDKIQQSYLQLQQSESANRTKLLQERLQQGHLGTAITWKTPDGVLHSGYASLDPSGKLVTHELPGILQQKTGAGMPMSVDEAKQRAAEIMGYDDPDQVPPEQQEAFKTMVEAFEKVLPKTNKPNTYDERMAQIDAWEKSGAISPQQASTMRMANVAPAAMPQSGTGMQGEWSYDPNAMGGRGGQVFHQVPTTHTNQRTLPSGMTLPGAVPPHLPQPATAPTAPGSAARHPLNPQHPRGQLTAIGQPKPQERTVKDPSAPVVSPGGIKTYPGLTRMTPDQINGIKIAQKDATEAQKSLGDYRDMQHFARLASVPGAGFAMQRMYYDHVRLAVIHAGRLTNTEFQQAQQAGGWMARLERFKDKAINGKMNRKDLNELLAIGKAAVDTKVSDARASWQLYNPDRPLPPWLGSAAGQDPNTVAIPDKVKAK